MQHTAGTPSPGARSWRAPALLATTLALAACATRPVNPPITQASADAGYTYQTRQKYFHNQQNLVILAFSGGGTRAAAFSYGVLEYLRNTEVVAPNGHRMRLLDGVDIITGVSGGSFTALAYGLYGEKLFTDYEQRFLKRDVQGEIISRAFNPGYWGDLSSTGWGRSELAAQLYDEILFEGATFGDLNRKPGPFVMVSATDISSGGRVSFHQGIFNLFCSDLDAVSLSRAAAASSAVPVVLSPVTLNNYGGTCGSTMPPWMKRFTESAELPRPAARVIRELHDAAKYSDSLSHPYIHLVDGGVSDNLGMRGVLDALSFLEALQEAGLPSPLDHVRKIVVIVVNSLSSPPTTWDKSEQAPGTLEVLLQATGVPIDHYSFEAVEMLKDTSARWAALRHVRELAQCSSHPDSAVCKDVRVPPAEIYPIDVSFAALKDKDRAEFDYLNQQPTTFVLPPEAVDRLRSAAGKIIANSPEFQRLLKDSGVKVVDAAPDGAAAPAASTSPKASGR